MTKPSTRILICTCIILMAACTMIALKSSSDTRLADYSDLRKTIDQHYKEGSGMISFDRSVIAGLGATEMMDILSSFRLEDKCSPKKCVSIYVPCDGGDYCIFLKNEIQRTNMISLGSEEESTLSLIVFEQDRTFRPSVHIYMNGEKKRMLGFPPYYIEEHGAANLILNGSKVIIKIRDLAMGEFENN